MTEESTGKKTIKAGFWYIICNVLSKGLVFLVTPVFTRLLSTQQFGIYTNFSTWQSFFLIIATLQLNSTIAVAWRDFRDDIDGYLSTIALLGSFVTIFEFAIISTNKLYFERVLSLDFKYIVILFLYLIFAPALQIFQTKNQFMLAYRKSTVVTLFFALFSMALAIFFCFRFSDRLFGRIVGYEGSLIILNALLYVRIILAGKKLSLKYCKYALKIGLPITVHLLAGNILASCDKIVIEKYCGYDDLALYGLGFTCAMAARVLWESTNQAIVPWLFKKLDENDTEQIQNVSSQYVFLFFVVLLGFSLFCPELVLIFGGEKYAQAVYVIPPIILAIGFQLIYSLYVNIETYCRQTATIAIGTVFSALINIVLNVVFVRKYGYVAAAYTTVVCYLCLCLFHYLKVKAMGRALLYNNKKLALYVFILCVCVLMCLPLYNHLILRIAVIIIYFTVLFFSLWLHRKKVLSVLRTLTSRC